MKMSEVYGADWGDGTRVTYLKCPLARSGEDLFECYDV